MKNSDYYRIEYNKSMPLIGDLTLLFSVAPSVSTRGYYFEQYAFQLVRSMIQVDVILTQLRDGDSE